MQTVCTLLIPGAQLPPKADAQCEGRLLDAAAAGCVQGDEGGKADGPRTEDPTATCATADDAAGPDAAPKVKPASRREFEHALRGLGFTRAEAKAIAANGFKATSADQDADHIDSLRQALERRALALKGNSK